MAPSAVDKYTQDGEEAREIAKYLPYFPFKGIPRFYDIGGFLYNPHVFLQIVDIFVISASLMAATAWAASVSESKTQTVATTCSGMGCSLTVTNVMTAKVGPFGSAHE